MKHFTVDFEDLKDLQKMELLLNDFVSKYRLPPPFKIKCIREHADYFAQNKVLIIVSSMALIKLNP